MFDDLIDEFWKEIPDFPSYSISTEGRVMNNETERIMATSRSNFGHVKVSIKDVHNCRRTVSVALLVAEAFVEPPDERSDNVILLDGNLENVHVSNLALRPRWFAWKYARQLRVPQPNHYQEPVYNVELDRFYDSIIECGIEHGLLFTDIWHSAHSTGRVYPYWWKFHALEK